MAVSVIKNDEYEISQLRSDVDNWLGNHYHLFKSNGTTINAGTVNRIESVFTDIPADAIVVPFIAGYNSSDWLKVTLSLMMTSGSKWNVIAYNHGNSAVTLDIWVKAYY